MSATNAGPSPATGDRGHGSVAGDIPAVALTPIFSARYRDEDLAQIRAAAPGARLVLVSREGAADGPLDDVTIVLRGAIPSDAFDRLAMRCRQLRWIHSTAAGVERVVTPAIRARGIVVTNGRGVFSRPIAEYVLLMILAVSRRLPALLDLQRDHTWQPLEGRELRDVTVGIVGLGSIGRAVAALASGFGCRIVAMRRHPELGDAAPALGDGDGLPTVPIRVDDIVGPEGLHALLARSDFVVLALPETGETENIIDDAALAAMKPGAWLINVARGRLVDERALLRRLREGPLGGAVLDAFREQPLPATSPFYDLPNVIVTPHTSWSSARVLDRSVTLFCENLRRYREGRPLVNVVDQEAGY